MTVAYIRKNKEPKKGLHWVWLVLIIFGVSGIISWAYGEKTYPVSMTKAEWVQFDKFINYSKDVMDRSTVPSNQVSLIKDSLTYFQIQLGKQLNPIFQKEADTTKKNEKPKQ